MPSFSHSSRAAPMIVASVSLNPVATARVSAGKLRARPSSQGRGAARRPGGFSAEHEARLSSENPTGGNTSMDEASVVDPYGHVADVMSCPARTLTTGLPLEDAIVATTMERYQVSFGFRLDIVSPRGALTRVVSTGRARRGPGDRGVLRRVIQNGPRQGQKPRRIHRGGRDV